MVRLARPWYGELGLGAAAGALTVACGVGLFAASGFLIARASQHPDEVALAVAVVAVRAFGIGRGVFRYLERLTTHDAALRTLAGLRERMWRRLTFVAPAGLGDRRSGDVLTRLVADVDSIQDLLVRGVTPPVVAAAVGAATVIALLTLSAPAAGVLAVGLLVAGIAVPLVTARAADAAARSTATQRGELAVGVTDVVDGCAELLAYGAAAAAVDRVVATDQALVRGVRRWSWAGGIGSALTSAVTGVSVWALLVVATVSASHGRIGEVGVAVLVLTGLAAFEATAPLTAAAQQLTAVRASARRVVDVLDAPSAVHEPGSPRAYLPAQGGPHLRLHDVTVRYAPDAPAAIERFDLDLPPGRRVALVGPSGAGKSTVAKVLLRLVDVEAGTVTLDGTALDAYAGDDVRRVVTGALADAHVFDSTLRENLRLAKPDATDDELDAVARRVRLHHWVHAQPAGWDTPVGANGAALSGGERQRLALARALLADRPVLVLDEPTAHLDAQTRDEVLADILASTAGRTLLLITHDRTGLEAMDDVVQLPCPAVTGRPRR
jgi:thiol reductant ABC exporter CydC subunit